MNVNKQTEALKVIFNAILKAQSKGVYTLKESADIHKHMKVFFTQKPILNSIKEEEKKE